MTMRSLFTLVVIVILSTFNVATLDARVYTSPDEAAQHPLFGLQGEYAGTVRMEGEEINLALQVAARGGDRLEGLLFHGGLPGAGGSYEDSVRVQATHEGEFVISAEPYELTPSEGGWSITHEEHGEIGFLGRVERRSPRSGVEPPPPAVVLFDENGANMLERVRITDDGLLKEGAQTEQGYKDVMIHVEFMLPYMPDARGQRRANSGIYIQNRYEVQILDSFAEPPTIDGAASFYREQAPLLNMSFPPLRWQTYDIVFRAPRFDAEGEKTANARVSVMHNGVLVHDDVELPHGTGAGKARGEGGPGPIIFQDHTGPVRFRNIWVVPLEL